jgi:Tetratricopeptide repeat
MAVAMRFGFTAAMVIAACITCPSIQGQNGGNGASPTSQNNSQQNQPAAPAPNVPRTQEKGNPFPGSTTNVPILPSGPTQNAPEDTYTPETSRAAFPPQDQDPVRSPDNSRPDSGETQGFSSSLSGVDDILPPPSEPSGNGKEDQEIAPMPRETPANDISVGNYYMSVNNWRAALSRFQSALVLEPDNPDVYWGLAESERHIGDYAAAREHYLKVLEYDPGSKHAKDAKKALRQPEIANSKAAPAGAANAARP